MKTKFMAVLAAAMTLALGCKTVDGERVLDAERVSSILGNAAYLGTTFYLRQHPERRPVFEVSVQSLTRLIDEQNYDPVAFSDALKALPVRELNGNNGDLYISTAIVVWDEVARSSDAVTQAEVVKRSLTAVRDGIKRALVVPPSPPTAPAKVIPNP